MDQFPVGNLLLTQNIKGGKMLNKLRDKQHVVTESPLRESLNRQINVSNLVIKHLNIFSSTKRDDCKRRLSVSDLEKTNIENMSML